LLDGLLKQLLHLRVRDLLFTGVGPVDHRADQMMTTVTKPWQRVVQRNFLAVLPAP
jgi:hypothetical protein